MWGLGVKVPGLGFRVGNFHVFNVRILRRYGVLGIFRIHAVRC